MEYIGFYVLGYFVAFVLLYIENKTLKCGKTKFSEALVVCLFSWLTVLLYVVAFAIEFLPNIPNMIDDKTKWFRE